MNTADKLKFYYNRSTELYRIQCISALLDWDQHVYMPPEAAAARAGQMEFITVLSHQRSTDPKYLKVVDELFEELDSLSDADKVNIRETKRVLDIERRIPEDFLAELQQNASMSYSEWLKARPANDFKAVQPYLEKSVKLLRQMCDLIGYEENPYDALLDQYEPGARMSWVKPLLLDLGEQLRTIIPAITAKFADKPQLNGHFPQFLQEQLSRRIVERLGFDFDSGRLDITAHPFMTSLGPRDFRITTHYNEANFIPALYSTIHETGHALYELGLPQEFVGTPRGSAVSLGIHESQSRTWENLVGRSREFSHYLLGQLKELFPKETHALNADDVWTYVNHVQPSLIRINADEVTYSQHIVIRMLLEEQLIKGELEVADLPEAWDDLYDEYLGIRPTDYKDGVMQDVHWYDSTIGYFPTYALGNLYNSMMMDAAKEAIPGLYHRFADGEFEPLLHWLRENVHQYGMTYRARDLIIKITGKDLSDKPFIQYLKTKFGV